MAETRFGDGIALNCGFDLGAKSLLDSRSIEKDAAELDAIPDIRRANGLLVWVQDEKKHVAWDEPGQAWVEVSGDKFDSTEIENRITEIENNMGNITVDDKFYDDKEYVLKTAHGGLKAGVDVKGMKIIDILKKILFPITLPTLKVSACDSYEGILGKSDSYPLQVISTGGRLAIDEQSIKIYYNGTALSDNSAEVELWNKDSTTTIYATASTVRNETGDEDLDAISAVTVTSNKLTYRASRPLRVFTMEGDGITSMTNDLGVMYPNGIDGGDCYLAKSRKVNIPAFSNKRICIISPEKNYSGWGYSSFFFAYPEKVIGTMKTTGSFMFPVTVEGTREDVINYFKRKLEDEEEDDMKGAEERLRHLRMLRLKAKAVKLSLELVKYSEEPDGMENDEEFKGKVLEFIRESPSNGRFSRNFDCTKLVSDETRTKIYRCNGWTVAKLKIPSHSIRHIHNRHGETFERPEDYLKILDVVKSPSGAHPGNDSYSVVLYKKYSGYQIKVVLITVPDPYKTTDDEDLRLKTSYKGSLGDQDAHNETPMDTSETSLPQPSVAAKLADIMIV